MEVLGEYGGVSQNMDVRVRMRRCEPEYGDVSQSVDVWASIFRCDQNVEMPAKIWPWEAKIWIYEPEYGFVSQNIEVRVRIWRSKAEYWDGRCGGSLGGVVAHWEVWWLIGWVHPTVVIKSRVQIRYLPDLWLAVVYRWVATRDGAACP